MVGQHHEGEQVPTGCKLRGLALQASRVILIPLFHQSWYYWMQRNTVKDNIVREEVPTTQILRGVVPRRLRVILMSSFALHSPTNVPTNFVERWMRSNTVVGQHHEGKQERKGGSHWLNTHCASWV